MLILKEKKDRQEGSWLFLPGKQHKFTFIYTTCHIEQLKGLPVTPYIYYTVSVSWLWSLGGDQTMMNCDVLTHPPQKLWTERFLVAQASVLLLSKDTISAANKQWRSIPQSSAAGKHSLQWGYWGVLLMKLSAEEMSPLSLGSHWPLEVVWPQSL